MHVNVIFEGCFIFDLSVTTFTKKGSRVTIIFTLQVSIRCEFLLASTIALVRFGRILVAAPKNIILHSVHYRMK